MPDLNEDLIRQITERVTREVLAAVHDPAPVVEVVEDWPEWDEFGGGGEASGSGAAVEASPLPRHEAPQDVVPEPPKPSPLREAARGNVPGVLATTDEGENISAEPMGMRGNVLPIGMMQERSGGFDPTGNADWFARDRAKLAQMRRQPTWETQVRQA